MVMLIPSLLAILYYLIANDRELRHELAQENYIYYAVFRGGLCKAVERCKIYI